MNFLNTLFLAIEGGYRTSEAGKTVVATANTQSETAGSIMGFFPLIILAVVFIGMNIFMGRSKKKENIQYQNMLSSLTEGDKVITSSGIIGEIAYINEKVIGLRVDKGTVIKFKKEFIKGKYND